MAGAFALGVLLCVILSSIASSEEGLFTASPVDESLLLEIYSKMQKLQLQESADFRSFPLRWAQQKGLYESSIHFNFIGGLGETEARRHVQFPDMNQFVSSFVLLSLLETSELGVSGLLDPTSFGIAIDALVEYQDRAMRASGTPVYRFWPQYEVDGHWECLPVNLAGMLKSFPTIDAFAEAVCGFFRLENCKEALQQLGNFVEDGLQAFHIPPDVDDTAVNLALGSLLSRHEAELPDAVATWKKANVDYQAVLDEIVLYAYRPFDAPPSPGGAPDAQLIDGRTYLVIHEFLESWNRSEPLRLPFTWLFNLTDTMKSFPYESMPLNVNNVDASVAANFLFGTSHLFLSESMSAGVTATAEFRELYHGAYTFLEWAILSGRVVERPDIALLYYPSLYDFFWFICRLSFLLNQGDQKQTPDGSSSFPFPEMEEASRGTLALVEGPVTTWLLKQRKGTADAYWDDFLGDYGKETRGEDRLFSTSLALNALIDGWTVASTTCKRQWRPETPSDVKQTSADAAAFLTKWILSNDYLKMNAFFSGSGKGLSTLPFFYPANFYEFLNGTRPHFEVFPPQESDGSILSKDLTEGMRGVVDPEQYATWLNEEWFGLLPAQKDVGYNNSTFPFWSSDALTYSMALNSLAKFKAASEC